MRPKSSFLRFADCCHLSTCFMADIDPDPGFKVHPGSGVCETINRRVSHCAKIPAQRFSGEKSLASLTLNTWQTSQGALWSTAYQKLLDGYQALTLVELKLVAEVGNQVPLASTDKACALLKWNSKKTMRAWGIFLPSQRCDCFTGSPGPCHALEEGHTSEALSTHRDVYCGLLCFWAAYQHFLQGAVQPGSAASELPGASAGSTSSFHPVTFLIVKSGWWNGPFCSVFMQPHAMTMKHGLGRDNENGLQYTMREAESYRCIRP